MQQPHNFASCLIQITQQAALHIKFICEWRYLHNRPTWNWIYYHCVSILYKRINHFQQICKTQRIHSKTNFWALWYSSFRLPQKFGSGDSSVCIEIMLLPGGIGIGLLFWLEERGYFLHQSVQTGCGTHRASYPTCILGGGDRRRCKAYHSSLPSADVKNTWIFTFTPPYYRNQSRITFWNLKTDVVEYCITRRN